MTTNSNTTSNLYRLVLVYADGAIECDPAFPTQHMAHDCAWPILTMPQAHYDFIDILDPSSKLVETLYPDGHSRDWTKPEATRVGYWKKPRA